jgi:hypothetical protein
MGVIMIRCPKTRHAISTGKRIEPATFRSSPVFFSRTYCPFCRSTHEWFAKDAWVCTANCADCRSGCERRAA